MSSEKISCTGGPHFGKHCIMPCGLFKRPVFQFLNLSLPFGLSRQVIPYIPLYQAKKLRTLIFFLSTKCFILHNGLV